MKDFNGYFPEMQKPAVSENDAVTAVKLCFAIFNTFETSKYNLLLVQFTVLNTFSQVHRTGGFHNALHLHRIMFFLHYEERRKRETKLQNKFQFLNSTCCERILNVDVNCESHLP